MLAACLNLWNVRFVLSHGVWFCWPPRWRRHGLPDELARRSIVRNGLLTAVGVVLVIAGVIWALQGFGVIGGSFMSGDSVWAIIGPIVAVAGLGTAAIGLRRARSSAS